MRKKELISRLSAYARIDTQSDYNSDTCPTTPGQWTLARMLVEELETIGMTDISIDDNGYVMATLPANVPYEVPTIGFLAHLDTATDLTGAGVNPQVVDNYDGGDIVLNEARGIVLSPRDFPALQRYKGHTLMTTDGTTLLGADDKSGIAIIMTAMAHLVQHPEIPRGKVRVAFTPDEEIGRGPHRFSVEAFGAKFAYTLDGGPEGELQFENFNAAAAHITVKGTSIHTGGAKGKLVHSAKIAMQLHSMLPAEEAPEHTSGYEGFYHLVSFQGEVEETKLYYLIRDFDREGFQSRKDKITAIVEELRAQYGAERLTLDITDQYLNMREKVEPVREVIDVAIRAMENLGVTPVIKAIRGGTDGSQLSYMGLPAPNLFAGGENAHGRYEYASIDVMDKATSTVVEIIRLFAEQPDRA